MVSFDFLNMSGFLNHKNYVNNGLKGETKVDLLDENDFGMFWKIDWTFSQAILIEYTNSVFFLRLLVVFEISVKQSGWIFDKSCSISEVEVYFLYSDRLFV